MDIREVVALGLADPDSWFHRDAALVFGSEAGVEETDDLFALAASAATASSLPAVYIACGTEDELIDSNERMHRHLDGLGLEHVYVTEPGGHEWGFWDRHIERFLSFLAGRKLLD
jgi:S-formylglutathione hydrolase FrmB